MAAVSVGAVDALGAEVVELLEVCVPAMVCVHTDDTCIRHRCTLPDVWMYGCIYERNLKKSIHYDLLLVGVLERLASGQRALGSRRDLRAP